MPFANPDRMIIFRSQLVAHCLASASPCLLEFLVPTTATIDSDLIASRLPFTNSHLGGWGETKQLLLDKPKILRERIRFPVLGFHLLFSQLSQAIGFRIEHRWIKVYANLIR